MGGLQEADKLFEVRGHEQGTLVGDDEHTRWGTALAGALDDDFGLRPATMVK